MPHVNRDEHSTAYCLAKSNRVSVAAVLDQLRHIPGHWKSLTAAGGFAAIKCLDCGFRAEGGYRDVVEAWNAHA